MEFIEQKKENPSKRGFLIPVRNRKCSGRYYARQEDGIYLFRTVVPLRPEAPVGDSTAPAGGAELPQTQITSRFALTSGLIESSGVSTKVALASLP